MPEIINVGRSIYRLGRAFLKMFARQEDGVSAIEFSLVATPFLLILMGIMELSLAFAAGTNLEGATLAAARTIRTGEAQSIDTVATGRSSEDVFFDRLCETATIFVDCADLKYQVVLLGDNSGFSNASGAAAAFDSNGDLVDADGNAGNSFDPGGISDVILIRVVYHYEFFTPFMNSIFANNDLGKMTFMSTIVMKNEPYDFEI